MFPLTSTYRPIAGELYPAASTKESDLLERALTKDANAFARLCRMHVGAIYATCLRMLANDHEAKEMTQQVVINAWEKLHTFRGECPFSAWLHRIAVNATLDHLKFHKRLSNTIEFTDEVERYETGEAVTSIESTIDLEEAIALLPAQARAVLVLHDIEGYRHDEIASMLGIAVGTSKAHLHRARLTLKEKLLQ